MIGRPAQRAGNPARRRRTLGLIAGVLAVAVFTTAGACGPSEDDERREAAAATKSQGPTLEKSNLEEKRKREENPNAIGYVYLVAWNGEPLGYYVTKGKISSNGSQATPEQDIHWTCRSSHGCQPVVVDGPQDDGSYGGHDPGIFFFLSDGTKVVTALDYVHSDRPIPALDAPLLGGTPAR